MGRPLPEITAEARANSERWFPLTHGPDATYPLTLHLALGLAGEVGEVCNDLKKGLRAGRVLGPELADELADVFIYLLLLAHEAGVDLEEAYETKQAFNEKRWGATPVDGTTIHPAGGDDDRPDWRDA